MTLLYDDIFFDVRLLTTTSSLVYFGNFFVYSDLFLCVYSIQPSKKKSLKMEPLSPSSYKYFKQRNLVELAWPLANNFKLN